MEFRILGPVEFWSSEQRQDLGWTKERHVLAILLMTPGKPVTAESLIHRVWDDRPPAKARDRLYTHIARLKRRLHDAEDTVRLRRHAGAYFLETDPENIDYHRFRTLRSQARAARENGESEQAFQLYREAVRLRRGEPLTGLSGSWAARTRQKLEEELRDSILERIELELNHGRNSDLVTELHELANRFPFDEKIVELLMLTLYRDGRQMEALTTYREARQRLIDELGTEPGPGLRTLHRRILQNDPVLLPTLRPGDQENIPPNHLPRDIYTFTGRTTELNLLTGGQTGRNTVTVLAIDGMAGVGKTALAVHLAHRLAGDYPDGQLYLDLHGHDTRHDAMDPATALDRLLRGLGIPGSRIPSSLDERATTWRTELAHRRVLIMLDNATGHEQISHLIPGTPGCLVVITSRRRLAGLDDVHSLSLDVLPAEDGAALFGRVVGSRLALPPEHVASVVRLCGRLPLAIQLVGNRLRHRPAWSVADLAELLGRAKRRLPEIRAENREITAAFELSFHSLDRRLQQAFWRLGLHPGADLTSESASALLGSNLTEAEKILDDFLDHHLIDESRRGRYHFHDLIREYALLLSDRETESLRTEVLQRAYDHYLFTASTADRMLYPHRAHGAFEVPDSSRPRIGFDTAEQALTWMNTELDNLILVTRHAAGHGWATHAAMLAHALSQHLDLWGHWAEGAEIHERAVATWRKLGDRLAMARAQGDLSVASWRIGRHDEALRLAAEALEIQRAAGDRWATGDLLDHSGLVHWHRSELDVALNYFEQALRLRRTIGDRHGQANSLNHIAFIHYHRGDYAESTEYMRRALALYREDGDQRGQQITLNNIGNVELQIGLHAEALSHYEEAASFDLQMGPHNTSLWLNNVGHAYQHLGRYNEALDYYRKSLKGSREVGDRWHEAKVLNNIGSCYALMGRDGEVLTHHQKALHISVDVSERREESLALRGIGAVHHRASRYDVAIGFYEKALDLQRGIGDVYQEALTLDEMSTALTHIGETARAEEHWRRALVLYDHLGVVEAEKLRRRLGGQGDGARS
ncbi:tetratricopeptide repeat protein [Streptosporangium sp. NPDC051023]|uniref:AfsR/SARP family transcriptional regulator n=1 Tax=Streptosporangium sp. NPDC051023 TaxID=3155410 RepID=UPI00344D0A5D